MSVLCNFWCCMPVLLGWLLYGASILSACALLGLIFSQVAVPIIALRRYYCYTWQDIAPAFMLCAAYIARTHVATRCFQSLKTCAVVDAFFFLFGASQPKRFVTFSANLLAFNPSLPNPPVFSFPDFPIVTQLCRSLLSTTARAFTVPYVNVYL